MATKEYFKRHYSTFFLEPYAVKLTNGELRVGDVEDNVIYEAELYIDETLEKGGEPRRYVIDDNTYYGQVPNIFEERHFGQKQVTFVMWLFYSSLAAALFIAFVAYNSGQTDYVQAFFGGVLIAAMAAFLTPLFLTKFTYIPQPSKYNTTKTDEPSQVQTQEVEEEGVDPDVAAILFPREEDEYVILEKYPENIEDYLESPIKVDNRTYEEKERDRLWAHIQFIREVVKHGKNPEVTQDNLDVLESLFIKEYGQEAYDQKMAE